LEFALQHLIFRLGGGKMSALVSGFALVTQYIRKLRGGSQPILAEASDGLLYVVKFTNNLQGANLSFNESAGTELYRACKLPVPSWKPLLVTDSFLDRNPDCWMETPEGRLRPRAGLCFGSRFLGDSESRIFEILPKSSFASVRNRNSFWLAWLIDICAAHADNRQAVFCEDAKRNLKAVFLDHGHLFGGPKGEQNPPFLTSRYLDPRVYESVFLLYLMDLPRLASIIDAERLWRRVDALSLDWKTPSGFGAFGHCLDRLANAKLLQNIVDTMIDAHQRTDRFARDDSPNRRKPPMAVLRPGVPVAEFVHGAAFDRVGGSRCA
jgi:hypothetical protein